MIFSIKNTSALHFNNHRVSASDAVGPRPLKPLNFSKKNFFTDSIYIKFWEKSQNF